MLVGVGIRERLPLPYGQVGPTSVLPAVSGHRMAFSIVRQEKVCCGVWCNEQGRDMTKLDQTIRHKCLNVHFQRLFRMYLSSRSRQGSEASSPAKTRAGRCNNVNREPFHRS